MLPAHDRASERRSPARRSNIPDPASGPRLVLIPAPCRQVQRRIEAMRSPCARPSLWFTQVPAHHLGALRRYGAHNAVSSRRHHANGFDMTAGLGTATSLPRPWPAPARNAASYPRSATTPHAVKIGAIPTPPPRELEAETPRRTASPQPHHLAFGVWMDRNRPSHGRPPRPNARAQARRTLFPSFERKFQ